MNTPKALAKMTRCARLSSANFVVAAYGQLWQLAVVNVVEITLITASGVALCWMRFGIRIGG